MKCDVQHKTSYLPVTALRAIYHGKVTLLLSNEGSTLCVTLPNHTDAPYCRKRIFEAQHIHGIINSPAAHNDNFTSYHLLLWGGCYVCTCLLLVENQQSRDSLPIIRLKPKRPLRLSDWIVAAVASSNEARAVILTAHNALWSVRMPALSKKSTSFLGRGIDTLLCSGAIIWPNDSQILVSSGTIFGEVIVWTCIQMASNSQWMISTRHMFLGHSGSVFGVAISDHITFENQQYRLVASCSDDRTIRLWDISDCGEDGFGAQRTSAFTYDTGFGTLEDSEKHLTTAWGHISRIWGIYFISAKPVSDNCVQLVSRGEDGVCQFWNLNLDVLSKSEGISMNKLSANNSDRCHAGKNIWSLDIYPDLGEMQVITGGADGQIVRRLNSDQRALDRRSRNFVAMINHQPHCSARAFRQYLGFADGTIIATTDYGCIVHGHINDPHSFVHLFEPLQKSSTTLSKNARRELAFYCLADGTLGFYDNLRKRHFKSIFRLSTQITWLEIIGIQIRDDDYEVIRLVLTSHKNVERVYLLLERRSDEIRVRTQWIRLPADFIISSSCYDPAYQVLIFGSRYGALAFYPETTSVEMDLSDSNIIRHVHGEDSITAIVTLSEFQHGQCSKSLYIITTGRDGTFAIHQLERNVPCTILKTIHRTSIPLGPDIEGICTPVNGSDDRSMVFYGFRGTEFIVWNEILQIQLLSVECGGGHRSWHYMPSKTRNSGGTFMWTKTGTLNSVTSNQSTHQSVKPGAHGREIKALAVSSAIKSSAQMSKHDCEYKVLASGSEDTDIRLFKYTTSSFRQLAILKQHTTGLQGLKFSSCDSYLFSSGGVEEFVVWRLSETPILEVGAVIVAVLPKTGEDNDARIVDFDICEPNLGSTIDRRFIIAMAYSNGKAKLFELTGVTGKHQGSFKLLHTLSLGTICLTQTRIISEKESISILLGATDGSLRLFSIGKTSKLVASKRIHQSNIATLSIRNVAAQSYLVATGGDDNALALTFVHTQDSQSGFKTVIVPQAHAAALTGLTTIELLGNIHGKLNFVVSVGNDQQVKVWRISGSNPGIKMCQSNLGPNADLREPDPQLELINACPTDVADASNIELIACVSENKSVTIEVLVVGVGMQSIVIRFNDALVNS